MVESEPPTERARRSGPGEDDAPATQLDEAASPDDEAEPRIDLGVVVARSPEGDSAELESFADRIARDAADELSSVTAAAWRAHVTEPAPLADGSTRRPSAFFDEAALRKLVVFPPNLMTNWPSLEDPTIRSVDLVRIGAFISTIGVLSGALAGGIEDRTIVRHLALFLDRP